jgi:hypothetical protein
MQNPSRREKERRPDLCGMLCLTVVVAKLKLEIEACHFVEKK